MRKSITEGLKHKKTFTINRGVFKTQPNNCYDYFLRLSGFFHLFNIILLIKFKLFQLDFFNDFLRGP